MPTCCRSTAPRAGSWPTVWAGIAAARSPRALRSKRCWPRFARSPPSPPTPSQRAHPARARRDCSPAQLADPSLGQMRSTIVVLVASDRHAVWGHLGDSRLYRLQAGRVVERTRDHSVSQALVDAGEVDASDQGKHEDRSRLLRCLGKDDGVEPAVHAVEPLCRDDDFLLCTDGFWEALSDTAIAADACGSRDAAGWLARLEARVTRGRPDDNYTASVIRVTSPDLPDSAGLTDCVSVPRTRRCDAPRRPLRRARLFPPHSLHGKRERALRERGRSSQRLCSSLRLGFAPRQPALIQRARAWLSSGQFVAPGADGGPCLPPWRSDAGRARDSNRGPCCRAASSRGSPPPPAGNAPPASGVVTPGPPRRRRRPQGPLRRARRRYQRPRISSRHGDDLPLVHEAIAAAAEGEEVWVGPGTPGAVRSIAKTLHVKGAGPRRLPQPSRAPSGGIEMTAARSPEGLDLRLRDEVGRALVLRGSFAGKGRPFPAKLPRSTSTADFVAQHRSRPSRLPRRRSSRSALTGQIDVGDVAAGAFHMQRLRDGSHRT